MSKEILIEKILFDGEKENNRILEEAREKAERVLTDAREKALAEISAREESALKFLPEQERRICSVAELEKKKLLLSAKQEVMTAMQEQAIIAVSALPDKDYLSVIRGMLLYASEDGDTVTISERDKERVTRAFIEGIANEMHISLNLSEEYGTFQGGILLSSDNYDKNMTLESELASIRESDEAHLAEILFDYVK